MNKREEEIAELILLLSEKSKSFTEPKMVVIGGYALRAFIPFSRYSRDCDFLMKEGMNVVKGWKPKDVEIETFERKNGYGYMRWVKIFEVGKKKAKLGIDFMEGLVKGREDEAFSIDEKFLADSRKIKIDVGKRSCEIFVPSYADFFILKVMSARRSDIRDIAALVWKNGLPDVKERLSALSNETIFLRNLKEKVIPEMENKFFLNSWKGMFLTEKFKEEDKKKVIDSLHSLLQK